MSNLTRKRAKKIMLKVWTYLRDHPWIKEKRDLPKRLYRKTEDLYNECPFCELTDGCTCLFDEERCTLDYKGSCYWFAKWMVARTDGDRSVAAGKIVEKVEKWEP